MQRADPGRASCGAESRARREIGACPVRGLSATEERRFTRVAADGGASQITRALADETPVALEINGVGYAVLMTSPIDLVDLAYGFLLTERLIDTAGDILDVETADVTSGVVVRVRVADPLADRLMLRVRHRTSDASCGLCGVETLEQALRPFPHPAPSWAGADTAIFTARAALDALQPINRATGAVHAAASCSAAGGIVRVREDVGRHNAFDKLIGAMLRGGEPWRDRFALITSRCSYELVEKAVLAGCPMLATISAPTGLAVQRAREAGLALRVLCRGDSLLAIDP